MSRKEQLKYYRSVRREALRAACAWDLSAKTFAAIKEPLAKAFSGFTQAAMICEDDVVRAQIMGAFAYATTLLGGSITYDRTLDVEPERWETGVAHVMVVRISNMGAEEGGAQ